MRGARTPRVGLVASRGEKQAGDRGARRVPFTPYRGSTLIEVPLSSTTRFGASASPSTSIATATSVLSGAMRRTRATSH